MRLLQVAMVLGVACASAQKIDILLMTVGETSLVKTEREGSRVRNYAVVNMKDRSYVAVTSAGNSVIETQEDCSRVYKSLKTMGHREEQEFFGLVTGIMDQFKAPISLSPGVKYALRVKDPLFVRMQDEPGLWEATNFGPPIWRGSFKQAEFMVEMFEDNISLAGARLKLAGSITRILFMGKMVIKVHTDSHLDAKPLHCFKGAEGRRLAALYAKLIEIRDQRREPSLPSVSMAVDDEPQLIDFLGKEPVRDAPSVELNERITNLYMPPDDHPLRLSPPAEINLDPAQETDIVFRIQQLGSEGSRDDPKDKPSSSKLPIIMLSSSPSD